MIFFVVCMLFLCVRGRYNETFIQHNDYKNKYLDLLQMLLVNLIYEENEEGIVQGSVLPENALTMIGVRRMVNLKNLLIETINENIEGDILEAGCWKGGAMMYARAILNAYDNNNKKVYCCDSFEGIPRMDDAKYYLDRIAYQYEFLNNNPVEEVIRNFNRLGLNEGTIIVKGYFHNTFPKLKVKRLSLLRLDGDTFNSTYISLFYMYPKLSVGGYIVIDDYIDWLGCRDATDIYRKENNITEVIKIVDYEYGEIVRGVYWKKEKEV